MLPRFAEYRVLYGCGMYYEEAGLLKGAFNKCGLNC